MRKLVAKAGRIARRAWRGAILGIVGLAVLLFLDVVLLDSNKDAGHTSDDDL